ncbi:MucBP domain-containing protein [Enterococcus hulanensis]|uniref:MucBP domain-containing protein n=1 Tax=Enterococcus hulanensis TaxID=2559929 RepID=A0ABU3EZF3_9ENTE|nr:MucBP domain-containing protein [Enterococcus hulanensis]MDT2600259.1 MucBP domain-containing protein [Enterococcus hulanensis]MDT2609072.1 MucBP domain-containing protein [Enterococcus hulanensis]MDT2616886.1 MucBP domain-containing protein [Enterococcus hulanensis]MDT2628594.1 MucBP domain-containing protein [Enterococcus hulanensis]MDT2655934.1 MucBP domain-containing protein [Enterococcus hulanensis]
MKKLGMKLVVLLFCCNIVLGGGAPALSAYAAEDNTSRASEAVETWMPDPNLRKAVAYYLGEIDPNEITKEAMASLNMLTFDQYTLDIPEGTVIDFTGLEYAGELLTLDTTYIVAENVPTIKVAADSFVYVMPNVLKKLENSGNVAQLQIGNRNDDGVPASELVGLGEYIHRLNPTDYLRILSKDMADFSSIGIQSESLTELWSAEFVTQSELTLPNLMLEKGHTGEFLYKQESLKDFMGNSLLSSTTHSSPPMTWFLNEDKEQITYPMVDYTEEGMVFESIPDEAAYVLVEFMRLPTRAGTRALDYGVYSLRALIPIVRFHPGADVTVKYQDEDGEQVAGDELLTGNVGDTYVSEQKIVDGYTFKEVQGEPTGLFTDQPKTVTYIYTKTPEQAGDVTVKYQDTAGETIADDVLLTGNIGNTYVSEQKTIDGYTFKEVQGDPTGPFTNQPQTVTYVYKKDTSAETAKVTVNYQDEAGKALADTITLTGEVGGKYTSEQKEIAGYTFKEVRGNAAGTFTAQPQEVTYVYTKATVKTKASTVTAKYQDEDGKSISEDVVLTGSIGADYKTEQKTIDGYDFKEVKGTTAGKFTDKAQQVVYIYKKKLAAADDPTDTNGTTTNVHSITSIHGWQGKILPKTGEETKLSHVMTLAGITLIFGLGSYLFVLKRRKS